MFFLLRIIIFLFIILLTNKIEAEPIHFKLEEGWDALGYNDLKEKLLHLEKTSPTQAIILGEYLIKRFPHQATPYNVCFNLYALKGQYDRAERILTSAIANLKDNERFYLRLAHFYKRVKPSELSTFIEKFRQNEKARADYQLLLAKFYIIAGQNEKAIDILQEVIAKGEAKPSTIKLLMKLYKQKGETNKIRDVIVPYLRTQQFSVEEQIELFKAFLSAKTRYKENDLSEIINLLHILLDRIEEYPTAKELVRETILMLTEKGQSVKFAELLKQNLSEKKSDERYLWLYCETLQHTGEPTKATNLIKEYTGKDVWLLRGKARLLSKDDKATTSALKVWQELITLKPKDKSIILGYAQFLNRIGRRKESQKVLSTLRPEDLSEYHRLIYFALCFDNLSALQNYRSLIKTWSEAGKYFDTPHLKAFKEGIMGNLPETRHHKSMMKIVNDLLTTHTTYSSYIALLELKIYLAEELRDFDTYFKTADEYLSSLKNFDADLIYSFVQPALRKGMRWEKRPGDEEPQLLWINKAFLDFAEKWLNKLIEKNPEIPDYYVNLIRLQKAEAREAEALKRVKGLINENENNAERIHLVGYVLANAGYPEEAIPYYKRAIALAPDIVRFRLNYAGCLVRAKRYGEAIQIYKDVLIGKYTARNWNMAELLQQIAYCYDKLNKKKEFVEFVNETKDNPAVSREDFYLASASVLAQQSFYDEAIQLLKEYIRSCEESDSLYNAYYRLAEVYIAQENYEAAKKVYRKCQQLFRDDLIKVIDSIYNEGEMERRMGNYDKAIKIWKELAEKYPDDVGAQNALISAAILAEREKSDKKMALELYREFMKINPKDIDNINLAREKIKILSGAE